MAWAVEFYFGCWAFLFRSSFCWRCVRITEGERRGRTDNSGTRHAGIYRQVRGVMAGHCRRRRHHGSGHVGSDGAGCGRRPGIDFTLEQPRRRGHDFRRHGRHLADSDAVDFRRTRWLHRRQAAHEMGGYPHARGLFQGYGAWTHYLGGGHGPGGDGAVEFRDIGRWCRRTRSPTVQRAPTPRYPPGHRG